MEGKNAQRVVLSQVSWKKQLVCLYTHVGRSFGWGDFFKGDHNCMNRKDECQLKFLGLSTP